MHRPLALALAVLVVIAELAPAHATAAAGAQFRAYWVDAFGDGLYDEAEIDALVAATKAANLNAIVAQVVRRGDCFCNDAAAPRTDAPIAPYPFDPLRSLVAKAHAHGIEVHAWIITTGIWRGTTPPPDPSHVFNRHGPSAAGRDYWLTVRADGVDRLGDDYFLDPGHADAAEWVVRVATSIVENYDVDGINLDRIRYPDGNLGTNVPSWGYNPTALARFQAATGRSDRPAPADPEWAQWRRDQVTSIVRKIYLESYAIRPRVRVSADTIAYGYGPSTQGGWEHTRTYAELLQDWRGWMREGILDLNVPMDYKRDALPDQRRMFSEWAAFAKDEQHRRQAAIGTALYLNEIDGSVRQVREALAPSAAGGVAAGWVGYSYRSPDAAATAGSRAGAASRAELARALTQASPYDALSPPVFASPASVPSMPWKAQPATGHLRGQARDGGGMPFADAQVDLYDDTTGAFVTSRRTDGRGWFGFVDLAPGRYRVQAGSGSATAAVLAGAVATANPIGSASCASSVGPGIPPPAKVPSGLSGFHASWYGQSGYPTLCPGQRATAVVAYYNAGSRGWVLARLGEVAYLGTWNPEPGQDRPTFLGGDGQLGSPDTGWPHYNRVAVQPAPYVGPNQVAWFQFTIEAPATPGTYRLSIRPLVEGATWMEDYGVFWYVTVRAP